MAGSKCLLVLFLFAASCSTPEPRLPEDHAKNDFMELAAVWSRASAEVRALYYQGYNVAKTALAANLKSTKTKKKPAVVVDIDETVLDNIPYQATVVLNGVDFPAGWQEWTDSAKALPLPGALDFLKYADGQGVAVFYVSNRKEPERPGTVKNLQDLGFPQATDDHVLLKTETSTKEHRRSSIEETHEIVLLVGDNLNDFHEAFAKKSTTDRKAEADAFRESFGTKFIVLPNAMYGEWEGAVYEYNWTQTAVEKSQKRRAAIRNP